MIALVGRCPANWLTGRGPIPPRRSFPAPPMRRGRPIRYHPRFPEAVPGRGAGCPRVTQPFATASPPGGVRPFDLHVLGAPPAFILSQDRTLRSERRPGAASVSFATDVRVPLQDHAGLGLHWNRLGAGVAPGIRASLVCPSSSDLSDTVSGSQGAPRRLPLGARRARK